MKIRLIRPGYQKFSGMFGAVKFEDGVSVEHVSQREADQIAAVTSVEAVEGDPSKLIGNRYRISKSVQAEVKTPSSAESPPQLPEEAEPVEKYSREQLEAIADKDGIAGLRQVGERLNVRDKSIVGLIDGILRAQG